MKKQNTKSNKGITLVALIITVIVLLILTVVAIRAITGSGVLDKAKTATNSYEDKRKEEENMLVDYAGMIDANMPQNTTAGGNEALFDINKILNKAYGAVWEKGVYLAYYLTKDTEGFKIQIVAFDKETKEELSADDSRTPEGGPRQIIPVSISTDFEPITIHVDGVETPINTSNAILCETINVYIIENFMARRSN